MPTSLLLVPLFPWSNSKSSHSTVFYYSCLYDDLAGFFSWGTGGPITQAAKMLPVPPTDHCPHFLMRAYPQISFVPENFKNYTSFKNSLDFDCFSAQKCTRKILEIAHIGVGGIFGLREQSLLSPPSSDSVHDRDRKSSPKVSPPPTTENFVKKNPALRPWNWGIDASRTFNYYCRLQNYGPTTVGSGVARGGWGWLPPGRNSAPPLAPQMKLHFVQRSMESCHCESQSAHPWAPLAATPLTVGFPPFRNFCLHIKWRMSDDR